MVTGRNHFEVCVLGTGPAGCIAAILSLRTGRRVALIGDFTSPAKTHCETLSDGAIEQLRFLQLAEAMDKSDLGPLSKKVLSWGTEAPIVLEGSGILINRARFDTSLRELARQCGVNFIASDRSVQAKKSGATCWRVVQEEYGQDGLTCDFLIDATGAGSRCTGEQSRMGLPLLAVSAEARCETLPPLTMFVEALKDGWLWMATDQARRVSACLFAEPGRAKISDLAGHFAGTLSKSMLVADAFSDVSFRNHCALNASSYAHQQPCEANRVVIGDACVSRDPLLSHGLQWAIKSAITGVAVANTFLSDPQKVELGIRYHKSRQQETIHGGSEACKSLYGEARARWESSFWLARSEHDSARAREEPKLKGVHSAQSAWWRFSEDARFESEPVLRGGRIDEAQALVHPSLERPIAFVGNVAITDLFGYSSQPVTKRCLTDQIARRLGPDSAKAFVSYLVENEVLVPANS